MSQVGYVAGNGQGAGSIRTESPFLKCFDDFERRKHVHRICGRSGIRRKLTPSKLLGLTVGGSDKVEIHVPLEFSVHLISISKFDFRSEFFSSKSHCDRAEDCWSGTERENWSHETVISK